MSKITLGTIHGEIVKLAKGVGNLKSHIDTEIHGLAFLIAKTEMKLIERIEGVEIGLTDLRKDMNTGFDRIDKTKISYNSPIKVKKSTKTA